MQQGVQNFGKDRLENESESESVFDECPCLLTSGWLEAAMIRIRRVMCVSWQHRHRSLEEEIADLEDELMQKRRRLAESQQLAEK